MNPTLRFKPLWLIVGYLLIAYVFYSSLRTDPIQVDVMFFDKYAHTFAYFVLMGWFVQIYHQKKSRMICGFSFILMGVSIEILQGLGGVRYFEYYDMLANSTGVIISWLLSITAFKDILFYFDKKIADFLA